MKPEALQHWLEEHRLKSNDPRVAITIAFRIAARFWPLSVTSDLLEDAALPSARALLIAERAARAPDKKQIRGMNDKAMMGASVAVMKPGWSQVNPLEAAARHDRTECKQPFDPPSNGCGPVNWRGTEIIVLPEVDPCLEQDLFAGLTFIFLSDCPPVGNPPGPVVEAAGQLCCADHELGQGADLSPSRCPEGGRGSL